MRPSVVVKRRNVMLGLGLATQFLLAGVLQAQSLTSGSLRGSVQTADGEPVAGASVSLESRTGGVLLSLETDRLGGFQAQLLTPGEYRILVEEIGYQPLRASGVIVTAGTVTTVLLTIERRPPPITSVTEVANPGARGGAIAGASLSGNALTAFNRPATSGGWDGMPPPSSPREMAGMAWGSAVAGSRFPTPDSLWTACWRPCCGIRAFGPSRSLLRCSSGTR